MVLPIAQAYVGEMIPSGQEGRVMGLFNISLFVGLSAEPVMGGLIKDWLNIGVFHRDGDPDTGGFSPMPFYASRGTGEKK